MSPRVLIVDDEANIRRMLTALLTAEGYEVEEAGNGTAGVAAVAENPPDAVLLDLMMPPGPDGLTTLEQIRAKTTDIPVIMMSGQAHITDAVRATKLGAFQFLEKPLTPESLLVTIRAALAMRRALVENRAFHEQLGHGDELVGVSDAMRTVRELIGRVARTEARVLITGESGTGKELVASAIHRASGRADEAFVCVNCAAIPRDLVESELFGHERGAFTGATERRIGRFELADSGTLFLDEVGDLSAEAQAKLLRALEAGVIERVGGERPIPVDVRTISATNKDLTRAARDGHFREDLLFRLNVFPIAIPPLRERPADIEPLIAHFAARMKTRLGRPVTYDAGAIALLKQYPWPGNVRELANILERLAILSPGPSITATDVERVLPTAGRTDGRTDRRTGSTEPAPTPAGDTAGLAQSLDQFERSLIARALSEAQGNVAEAARRLATDRANLYRRMRRLGLEPPRRLDV
jgi:DNA-binding NtrC family response regulator